MTVKHDTTAAVDVLFEQASQQIDQGHDAFTVACALAPEHIDDLNDARTDWHHQYSLNAHVRTMILRELWGWKWSELHRFLQKNDHAKTIGYDPEKFKEGNDAPSYSAINRAWKDYFPDDLKHLVTETVQLIREHARETGNLLGNQTLQDEDKTDASERTQYRFKRRLTHEMAEKFRDWFYDEIESNIPDDARAKMLRYRPFFSR